MHEALTKKFCVFAVAHHRCTNSSNNCNDKGCLAFYSSKAKHDNYSHPHPHFNKKKNGQPNHCCHLSREFGLFLLLFLSLFWFRSLNLCFHGRICNPAANSKRDNHGVKQNRAEMKKNFPLAARNESPVGR